MLLYDITSDRVRLKVAETCLDYGLDRVQYSAFVGDLSRNHQEELMLKCTRLLGQEAGAVLLIPIDWDRRRECRNEPVENEPLDQHHRPETGGAE